MGLVAQGQGVRLTGRAGDQKLDGRAGAGNTEEGGEVWDEVKDKL